MQQRALANCLVASLWNVPFTMAGRGAEAAEPVTSVHEASKMAASTPGGDSFEGWMLHYGGKGTHWGPMEDAGRTPHYKKQQKAMVEVDMPG